MPAATEPAAPKASKKPAAEGSKPAPKKKATAPAPAQAGEKKSAADTKPATPAAEKKPSTPAAEKKPKTTTTPADKTQITAPAAGKKPKNTTPADKKQTAPAAAADKKQAAPAADKKASGPAADKKSPATKRSSDDWADEPPAPPVFVPKAPVALPVLNTLEWASCAKLLENLLNLTPSLGAALAHLRPFKSTQHVVDQLNAALDALPQTYIEAFLKRFNELPLIPKSKLTKEQKCCVGLDKLTEDQVSELKPLYTEYREKFGFPFVLCAREAQAGQLAVALRSRLLNEKAQELETGRKEVKKVARMRLLEVVVA